MTIDNLHRRLLDHLSTGVIVFDHELRLGYINLAAESILAISGRQVQGAWIGDIFLNSAQDIAEIRNAQTSNHSFTKRKTELTTLQNQTMSVDYTITPLTDMDDAHILMEIQAINYAERISKEEALISTHETTRELVRGLAHEIKNPLGGIRGAAQLLARELPDSDLTDYTNVIIEEADRLHKLVDRLVGSRKLPELKLVNIHEVLERVRSLIEAEVVDKDIRIERNYDPSIPDVMADSEQLIQAVLNIVRNAMQALESPNVRHNTGTIELTTRVLRNVTIGSVFHRLAARIEITDNGPGIPDDLIGSIFYPMISGRAEGTGLGLSIAHSIITQHKGMIECSSKPGKTRFAIFIPVAPRARNKRKLAES
ncbi:MAG: nitrogen regulation protein NR(II) [Gammaproteobacteria bacterium]|nr:nitrogen regulation protein NR(II) [Gammaproteobacteria bacterium]MDP2139919.1 nitrogen regulation protein NR(II) [Gammaproteobacteria bacterium]MDP2347739.1 nitrogen regulation protein NR(II) [Gammaproteobacteria bacterium]